MVKESCESDGRLVVLACDEAYAMPLATTLRSVVEANRKHWPVAFCVLSDGIPEPVRERVLHSLPEGSAQILWKTVDLTRYEEFSTLPHISKATFGRLLIPRVVPATVSRVLYLDSDLLVLDDLEPVWSANLDGAVVGAVLDLMDPILKRGEPGWEEMPRVRDYFNAGVLLMDLGPWRNERISERALEYLSQHPETPRADQDALNVACDGRWKKLDGRWNLQCFRNENLAAMGPVERPGIAHFITRKKPWDPSQRNLNAGFYDAFRARTLFARSPLERLLDSWRRTRAGFGNVLRRRGFLPPADTNPAPTRRRQAGQ
jgi:lipopolysaccharide biosynthesis glycosyltransferase